MDFAYSKKVTELQGRLLEFMDSQVYPAEKTYRHQMESALSLIHI